MDFSLPPSSKRIFVLLALIAGGALVLWSLRGGRLLKSVVVNDQTLQAQVTAVGGNLSNQAGDEKGGSFDFTPQEPNSKITISIPTSLTSTDVFQGMVEYEEDNSGNSVSPTSSMRLSSNRDALTVDILSLKDQDSHELKGLSCSNRYGGVVVANAVTNNDLKSISLVNQSDGKYDFSLLLTKPRAASVKNYVVSCQTTIGNNVFKKDFPFTVHFTDSSLQSVTDDYGLVSLSIDRDMPQEAVIGDSFVPYFHIQDNAIQKTYYKNSTYNNSTVEVQNVHVIKERIFSEMIDPAYNALLEEHDYDPWSRVTAFGSGLASFTCPREGSFPINYFMTLTADLKAKDFVQKINQNIYVEQKVNCIKSSGTVDINPGQGTGKSGFKIDKASAILLPNGDVSMIVQSSSDDLNFKGTLGIDFGGKTSDDPIILQSGNGIIRAKFIIPKSSLKNPGPTTFLDWLLSVNKVQAENTGAVVGSIKILILEQQRNALGQRASVYSVPATVTVTPRQSAAEKKSINESSMVVNAQNAPKEGVLGTFIGGSLEEELAPPMVRGDEPVIGGQDPHHMIDFVTLEPHKEKSNFGLVRVYCNQGITALTPAAGPTGTIGRFSPGEDKNEYEMDYKSFFDDPVIPERTVHLNASCENERNSGSRPYQLNLKNLTGSLTIQKKYDMIYADGTIMNNQIYSYTVKGLIPKTFILGKDDIQDFGRLFPGEYTIHEEALPDQPGISLDSIDCSDKDLSTNRDSNVRFGNLSKKIATISVVAGHSYHCDFISTIKQGSQWNPRPLPFTSVFIGSAGEKISGTINGRKMIFSQNSKNQFSIDNVSRNDLEKDLNIRLTVNLDDDFVSENPDVTSFEAVVRSNTEDLISPSGLVNIERDEENIFTIDPKKLSSGNDTIVFFFKDDDGNHPISLPMLSIPLVKDITSSSASIDVPSRIRKNGNEITTAKVKVSVGRSFTTTVKWYPSMVYYGPFTSSKEKDLPGEVTLLKPSIDDQSLGLKFTASDIPLQDQRARWYQQITFDTDQDFFRKDVIIDFPFQGTSVGAITFDTVVSQKDMGFALPESQSDAVTSKVISGKKKKFKNVIPAPADGISWNGLSLKYWIVGGSLKAICKKIANITGNVQMGHLRKDLFSDNSANNSDEIHVSYRVVSSLAPDTYDDEFPTSDSTPSRRKVPISLSCSIPSNQASSSSSSPIGNDVSVNLLAIFADDDEIIPDIGGNTPNEHHDDDSDQHTNNQNQPPTGTLIVNEQSSPQSDEVFTFTITPKPVTMESPFQLSDNGGNDPVSMSRRTKSAQVVSSMYIITENKNTTLDTPLQSITCSISGTNQDGSYGSSDIAGDTLSRSVNITLAPGKTAICTFINAPLVCKLVVCADAQKKMIDYQKQIDDAKKKLPLNQDNTPDLLKLFSDMITTALEKRQQDAVDWFNRINPIFENIKKLKARSTQCFDNTCPAMTCYPCSIDRNILQKDYNELNRLTMLYKQALTKNNKKSSDALEKQIKDLNDSIDAEKRFYGQLKVQCESYSKSYETNLCERIPDAPKQTGITEGDFGGDTDAIKNCNACEQEYLVPAKIQIESLGQQIVIVKKIFARPSSTATSAFAKAMDNIRNMRKGIQQSLDAYKQCQKDASITGKCEETPVIPDLDRCVDICEPFKDNYFKDREKKICSELDGFDNGENQKKIKSLKQDIKNLVNTIKAQMQQLNNIPNLRDSAGSLADVKQQVETLNKNIGDIKSQQSKEIISTDKDVRLGRMMDPLVKQKDALQQYLNRQADVSEQAATKLQNSIDGNNERLETMKKQLDGLKNNNKEKTQRQYRSDLKEINFCNNVCPEQKYDPNPKNPPKDCPKNGDSTPPTPSSENEPSKEGSGGDGGGGGEGGGGKVGGGGNPPPPPNTVETQLLAKHVKDQNNNAETSSLNAQTFMDFSKEICTDGPDVCTDPVILCQAGLFGRKKLLEQASVASTGRQKEDIDNTLIALNKHIQDHCPTVTSCQDLTAYHRRLEALQREKRDGGPSPTSAVGQDMLDLEIRGVEDALKICPTVTKEMDSSSNSVEVHEYDNPKRKITFITGKDGTIVVEDKDNIRTVTTKTPEGIHVEVQQIDDRGNVVQNSQVTQTTQNLCSKALKDFYDYYNQQIDQLNAMGEKLSMDGRIEAAKWLQQNKDMRDHLKTIKVCGPLHELASSCPKDCGQDTDNVKQLQRLVNKFNTLPPSDTKGRASAAIDVQEYLNKPENNEVFNNFFGCAKKKNQVVKLAGADSPLVNQCSEIGMRLPAEMAYQGKPVTTEGRDSEGRLITQVQDSDGNVKQYFTDKDGTVHVISKNTEGTISLKTNGDEKTVVTQIGNATEEDAYVGGEVVYSPTGILIKGGKRVRVKGVKSEPTSSGGTKVTTTVQDQAARAGERVPPPTVTEDYYAKGKTVGKDSPEKSETHSQVASVPNDNCEDCRNMNKKLYDEYQRYQNAMSKLRNIDAADSKQKISDNQKILVDPTSTDQAKQGAVQQINNIFGQAKGSYTAANGIFSAFDAWQKKLSAADKADLEKIKHCHDLVLAGTCKENFPAKSGFFTNDYMRTRFLEDAKANFETVQKTVSDLMELINTRLVNSNEKCPVVKLVDTDVAKSIKSSISKLRDLKMDPNIIKAIEGDVFSQLEAQKENFKGSGIDVDKVKKLYYS